MSEQLKSYCDNISNSIINAYKMGVQNGNIEKYRDTTNIENLAKKLCQVEALFSNELNAINNSTFRDLKTFDQETKKVLQDCSQTVSNEASISKRYHDITEGCATIYLAATEMKEGTTQFQGDRTVIDDDVQMGTTEQFTDPITKKQIQNPYRNKFCNHIYEYTSIEASLKNGAFMRCPYVGCGNRNQLKMSDLIEDREARIKIMQNEQLNDTINDSEDLF